MPVLCEALGEITAKNLIRHVLHGSARMTAWGTIPSGAKLHLLLTPPDLSQMRVVEAGSILEAVAHHAVKAHMGHPDRGAARKDGAQYVEPHPPAQSTQENWSYR
jgi:hypothetical protein